MIGNIKEISFIWDEEKNSYKIQCIPEHIDIRDIQLLLGHLQVDFAKLNKPCYCKQCNQSRQKLAEEKKKEWVNNGA